MVQPLQVVRPRAEAPTQVIDAVALVAMIAEDAAEHRIRVTVIVLQDLSLRCGMTVG